MPHFTLIGNRLRRFFVLSICLVVAPDALVAGEPEVLEPGKGSVVVYGGAMSADHFYTIDGDLRRFDSVGTEFRAVTFGTSFRYGLISGMEIDVEVPFAYYSVRSRSRFPDRSIFTPAYFGLTGVVRLLEAPVQASVDVGVRIPPGFHRGIYDDPNHPSFLSDGFLQASAGLNVGGRIESVWLKGRCAFNWRDEEPVNEIAYALQVGLTRVEGTGIYVGFDGVVPLADVAYPAHPFYAGSSGNLLELARLDGGTGRFATIDREMYMALNAGAFVNITSSVYLAANYSIRLLGANSLALAGGFIGAGFSY